MINDWVCGPESNHSKVWEASTRWEQDHSNEWDLWIADNEEVRALNEEANRLTTTDPKRAFEIRERLAEDGSVWATRQLGRHYHHGLGVSQNLERAEYFYYRAQLAGSWMATLQLSQLLFQHDINEKWQAILQNGVESEFIPAHFWLAWYRYKTNPRRATARSVRPLMEIAGNAGHPGARLTLARWKGQGKFGLGKIREGFREIRSLSTDLRSDKLRHLAPRL